LKTARFQKENKNGQSIFEIASAKPLGGRHKSVEDLPFERLQRPPLPVPALAALGAVAAFVSVGPGA
jgi:hypothetical protein